MECDQLIPIIWDLKMSVSQKCCMYNLRWKENFSDAGKWCSKFNSIVYPIKSIGYKEILNNYANYINSNFNRGNISDILYFWTSCKKFQKELSFNGNDLECSNLTHLAPYKTIEDDRLKKLGDCFTVVVFRLKINLTKDFICLENHLKEINRINLQDNIDNLKFLYELYVKNLTFLARRKSTATHFRIENIKPNSENTNCYYFVKENNQTLISLPLLDKCYHLSINPLDNLTRLPQFNHYLNLKDLKFEVLSSILNMIGILDFVQDSNSLMNSQNNSFIVLKLENNEILRYKIMSFDNFVIDKIYLNDYLSSNKHFVINLNGYNSIYKVLYLNCWKIAARAMSYLNECLDYYSNERCEIACPSDCPQQNVPNIWIYRNLAWNYLNKSSICLSGFHSNVFNNQNVINNGTYFRANLFPGLKNFSETGLVFNNKILATIWPPSFLNNTLDIQAKSLFHFNKTEPSLENFKFPGNLAYVLLNSSYQSDSISDKIIIKIFSHEEIETIGLKRILYKDLDLNWNITKETLNQIDLELKNNFSLSNDFYEVLINLNKSIKFPINFQTKESSSYIPYHTLRLSKIQSHIINLGYESIKDCSWFLMGSNTRLNCDNQLMINNQTESEYKDLEKQMLIIYPNATLINFLRVVVLNKNFNHDCLNGGEWNEVNCVCLPGFYGVKCEKVCSKSHFGQNCEFFCPNFDCFQYLICVQDPIGCSCGSGYEGLNCDKECNDSKWGPECKFNCTHCLNSKCDKFTGFCDKIQIMAEDLFVNTTQVCVQDSNSTEKTTTSSFKECDECLSISTVNNFTNFTMIPSFEEKNVPVKDHYKFFGYISFEVKIIFLWSLTLTIILFVSFISKLISNRNEINSKEFDLYDFQLNDSMPLKSFEKFEN